MNEEKTQWKKNDEENNQNNQQKSVDWLKWYNQQINQMNEKGRMSKMIWRLKNSNKLISVFVSLFHFYHLLINAELRIDNLKGKVCFIYKKFGQNWSKNTTIFLCFNKKFLKSLELGQIVKCHLMFDDLIKLFLIKFSNFDVLVKYLIKKCQFFIKSSKFIKNEWK